MEKKVDAAVVLKAVEAEAAPLFKKLSKIEAIATREDYERAIELTKNLKELGTIAKNKELSLTTPLNNVVRDIRDLFRPFISMVSEYESIIKIQMVKFIEIEEAAAKQLEQDFSNGKIKRVSTFAKKSAELTIKKSGARKVWKAIEVDGSKTPRKYLVPDEQAITNDLKMGKKVAGWKWEQVNQVAI